MYNILFLYFIFNFSSLLLLLDLSAYSLGQVVIPILDWETTKFSTPDLGFILFYSIAVFPTFLLPSSPSMWLAGMTFGYGYGFLLIMAGMGIGMSLPYFVGSLFRVRIHVSLWLAFENFWFVTIFNHLTLLP